MLSSSQTAESDSVGGLPEDIEAYVSPEWTAGLFQRLAPSCPTARVPSILAPYAFHAGNPLTIQPAREVSQFLGVEVHRPRRESPRLPVMQEVGNVPRQVRGAG